MSSPALTHSLFSRITICLALTLPMFSPAARAQTPIQTPDWAWIGGTSTPTCSSPSACGLPGVYGNLGTGASGNIPGSRFGAATWTDFSGNFWLFGGLGFDSTGTAGSLNDIWVFTPSSPQWTWLGGSSTLNCSNPGGCGQPGVYGTLGIAAPGNTPGSRSNAATWTDNLGNLWLFGGNGLDANGTAGILNDLWEFDPLNQVWAWMGGSSTVGGNGGQPGVYGTLGTPASANIPGSRGSASTWTDAGGDLWLFGGSGFDSAGTAGPLNDLWEFNPSAGQWTWQSGSSTLSCVSGACAPPGVYGTLQTLAPTNVPGGRNSASSWIDFNGNLWLFGGVDSDPNGGYFNDLWLFKPSLLEWEWMGGSNTLNQPGVYGTLGTPTSANIPGSRSSAPTWTDQAGNFWLFGGLNSALNPGQSSDFNDLWQFSPSTLEWTWMGGSSAILCSGSFGCGQPAVYGTLDIPAPANTPGGRNAAAAWVDSSNNLWLFGGNGIDPTAFAAYLLSDLWESGLPAAAPSFSIPAGTYTAPQHLTITDVTTGATIYYTTDGTTPTTASAIYTTPIAITQTTTVTAFAAPPATSPGQMNSPLTVATYTLQSTPTILVTPSSSSTSTLQPLTVTIAVSGNNGTPTGSVSLSSGSYSAPATTLSNGAATISIPAGSLPAGTDTLASSYTPDTASSPIYTTASATASVTVTAPSAPKVLVTPSSSSASTLQPLTVSIVVSGNNGTPTGSVTLSSGSYSSPATTLSNGAATISIPAGSLPAGTDTLASSYTPDTASSPIYTTASATASVTVTAPTFALSNSGNISVSPGATTGNTSTISITPSGGFTGTVTLTCAITTSLATVTSAPSCSLTPPSANVTGAAAVTSTLTITTFASTTTAQNHPSHWPLTPVGGAALAALTFFLLTPRKRRSFPSLFLILLVASFAITASGCGGHPSGSGGQPVTTGSPGTTAGAYTVTVTGTSASIPESTSVSLTVTN